MKLLTQAIKKRLPKLYSTDGQERDKEVICKFFTPDSSWTWFILEGEEQPDGDWLFFALVQGLETELGYVSLRELESVRGPLGLPIERDLYFNKRKKTLAEADPEFCNRLWPER